MKEKDMRDFFDDVLIEYLEAIEKRFVDYKKSFRVRYSKLDVWLVHRFYERERRRFYRYMEKEVDALDSHKVAAAFIYALLKHKLVVISRIKQKDLPEELLMANEYLAVTVALNIVSMYRRDAARRKGIEEDKSFKIEIPKTKIPLSKEDKEHTQDYLSLVCKALYYLRSKSCGFDGFAYANILFLLEIYSDNIRKNNGHHKEC